MAKKPDSATHRDRDSADANGDSAKRRATEKKGKATPKRPKNHKPRPPANPPKNLREMREQRKASKPVSKEEKKALRAKRREERQKVAEGQWRGDPLYDQYHLPRDRGKERLLARDIVDSRRNVAQYLFFVAIILLVLSPVFQVEFGAAGSLAVNAVWLVLLISVVIDSTVLAKKTWRLVTKRFPNTQERKRSLYWYVISRSIMFRSMRQPRVRMTYKAKEDDLGKFVQD
ncbi:DUF3043 domain-containing protein [Haloglycomyces albus]|uniref:DUF3043 domain-containing protein n=1 Tax=Haloglycomyces albus TaxID=526067 RepID=UPI00046D8716|nr:DUF3043 domain-containing protein [Haloglycomyces albus]